jgi:tRNA-dihydrouridine synthase
MTAQSHSNHFVLAPIRGITNYIYRNAIESTFGGVDSAIAPYIVTKSSNELNNKQLTDLDITKNLLPTTAQILTKEADQFLFAAKAYQQLGVKKVNLNMGCPYPMVANRTKGSGLLLHPEKVKALLETIKEKCPIEFTVKIRLGRENPEEIKKIIPIINELEIDDFTIHARIGKQIYKGSVNIDGFEDCLPLLNHSPCYNGDIRTVKDFKRVSTRLPSINKWMIGRGALANPALFAQINGEVFNEESYRARLFEMHNKISQGYLSLPNAKSDFLTRMREQWFYLSEVFENSSKVYKKVKKAKSLDNYHDVTSWIFEQDIKPSVYEQ